MLTSHDGDMLDVTAPEWVQIEISHDGKVVWVHVNGITLFRACRIQHTVEVEDKRPGARRKSKKQIPGETLD
jgi:hypothetical protein